MAQAKKYGDVYFGKFFNMTITRGGAAADISPITALGVPGFSLTNQAMGPPNFSYFDIHHTHADTFDKVNEEVLRKGVSVMSAIAYLTSQSEFPIPRD